LVASTIFSPLDLGQRLAHDLLGLAEGVDVGRVDEVDAGVERRVDDADRLVVVGLPQAPNIMAPRQSGLTLIPVRPRVRYSMGRW
jgi:hypothetical protein